MSDNYTRLGMAVVLQAFKDCQRGDVEARDWLHSEAPAWLDWLGVIVNERTWNIRICEEYGKFRNGKSRKSTAILHGTQ